MQAKNGSDVRTGDLALSLASFYRSYEQSLSTTYGDFLQGPVLSYYLLKAVTPELAAPLVSMDNSSTLFVVSYVHLPSDKDNVAFIRFLLDEAVRLLSLAGLSDRVSPGLTGI